MKKQVLIGIMLAIFAGKTQAQWAVIDPSNIATSIANSVQELIPAASTAANMINNFKEVKKVYEQGKEYYDKLKKVNSVIQNAKKVKETILLVGEISDIYIENFEKMLTDKNFTVQELSAISSGYAVLLQQGADMLLEMKDVANANGLSMTDAERINIINYVYDNLRKHRNLVNYYTRKNISVSYLRAKKTGDTARVLALYGNAGERYW
ncbi:MAG: DUF4141 domain-containing protein [Prevotellaceae bacterium]|jgi:hypothetical protein|nr:DUF4141 domain-containing protein [Prevotellaceae bacterium]